MQILGWDIGGAHLKVARMNAQGQLLGTHQVACPLWLGLDQLETALHTLQREASVSPEDQHAVTMTGELADYFENRKAGVTAILTQFTQTLNTPYIKVFGGPQGFLAPQALKEDDWQWVASANWLASGQWAAQRVSEGLFIDIGSTTADFLLLSGGTPQARGYSDHERMSLDELVYTGATRTPIMALTTQAPILGAWSSPMAEYFATTADLYRTTGELREATDQHPSADGGPKTRAASARRLGRQFGVDAETLPKGTIEALAHYLREQQIKRLHDAFMRQISRGMISLDAPVIGAGIGRFLARDLAERTQRSFIDYKDLFEWSPCGTPFDAADCGPAAAVAALSLA